MPCTAEFGIIDRLDPERDYADSYDPKRYRCIPLDDGFLNDWWEELASLKTFFHCCSRPNTGLARWGVTLIPPESARRFHEIVSHDPRTQTSEELSSLLALLQKAAEDHKYVIHYGV